MKTTSNPDGLVWVEGVGTCLPVKSSVNLADFLTADELAKTVRELQGALAYWIKVANDREEYVYDTLGPDARDEMNRVIADEQIA